VCPGLGGVDRSPRVAQSRTVSLGGPNSASDLAMSNTAVANDRGTLGGLWSRTRLGSILAVFAGVVAVYAMRRADPDLFGYLAYGRYFVERGGPTSQDIFSYTCPQCTWVYFEYLAHISLWLAYQAGGAVGLIALKCFVGAACVFTVLATLRSVAPRAAVWWPVYLLTLGTVPRFFLFRPQIYTFAFLAFFVAALFRYLSGRRARLWLLPIALAVWANLHGGFLAGLGVIMLAGLLSCARAWNRAGVSLRTGLSEARPIWVVAGACAIASFLTPQTWRLWSYLLTELIHDTNRTFIREWMPLSFSRDPWSAGAFVVAVTALCVATLACASRHASPLGLRPWQWAASCVPLMAMSLLSARHVPVFVLWSGPVIALLADSGRLDVAEGRWRRPWIALSGAMALPAALTLLVVLYNPWPRIALGPRVFGATSPYSAAAYFRSNALSGNVFTPLWWGSYLTWSLHPAVHVSMDGRNVSVYPPAMVRENLEFYLRGTAQVDVPLRYRTDYLLVPRDAPPAMRLRADSRWVLLFEDTDSLIFLKSDNLHGAILTRHKEGRLRPASQNEGLFLH